MSDKRARTDWRGYLPAITTPFSEQGDLDLKGLGGLLDWLHAEGMHGLVVAGTTGEWFSLKPVERKQLFDAVGAQMKGKLPLIAGCNAFNAADVVELSGHAKAAGFDGILVTPPPYIVPSEDEIYHFYRQVSEGSALPICVYNWPPGTNVDMSVELLERISDLEMVVAVKQSTGRLENFIKTFFALKDKVRVFGFSMDELGITLLREHNGDGTMGAGAVLGRDHPDFYNNLWKGDLDAARHCGARDQVIMKAWFTPQLTGRFGSAQAILKAGLNARGVPGGYTRPPIRNLSPEHRESVADTLRSLGLLPA